MRKEMEELTTDLWGCVGNNTRVTEPVKYKGCVLFEEKETVIVFSILRKLM